MVSQSGVSILQLNFNATAIKVEPPAVLNFILNELGVDLNQILDQFNQFSKKILEVKEQVQVKVASFFDLNSFFEPLGKVWDAVSSETSSINDTFTNITNQMAEGIEFVRPMVYAAIFGPIAIFICIFVAYTVIYVRFIVESKKTKLFFIGELMLN